MRFFVAVVAIMCAACFSQNRAVGGGCVDDSECWTGQFCDVSGQCVGPSTERLDAGVVQVDASDIPDAGVPDAGMSVDAGSVDAGPYDAGIGYDRCTYDTDCADSQTCGTVMGLTGTYCIENNRFCQPCSQDSDCGARSNACIHDPRSNGYVAYCGVACAPTQPLCAPYTVAGRGAECLILGDKDAQCAAPAFELCVWGP
jgi:hypothetical protein